MRRLFSILTCLLVFTVPAALAAGATDCVPLAYIYGTPVCRAPDAPSDTAPEDARAALAGLLWRQALLHKFGADALTPDDARIDSVRRLQAVRRDSHYEADRQAAALLEKRLAADKMTAGGKQAVTELLTALKASMKLYEQRRDYALSVPEDLRFLAAQAETEQARAFLTEWLADKALYDAYRGKLSVTTDNVIRPLAACRSFVADMKREKQPDIRDKAFAGLLDDYVAALEKDSRPAAPEDHHYFRDPADALRPVDTAHRLKRLSGWLDRQGAAAP